MGRCVPVFVAVVLLGGAAAARGPGDAPASLAAPGATVRAGVLPNASGADAHGTRDAALPTHVGASSMSDAAPTVSGPAAPTASDPSESVQGFGMPRVNGAPGSASGSAVSSASNAPSSVTGDDVPRASDAPSPAPGGDASRVSGAPSSVMGDEAPTRSDAASLASGGDAPSPLDAVTGSDAPRASDTPPSALDTQLPTVAPPTAAGPDAPTRSDAPLTASPSEAPSADLLRNRPGRGLLTHDEHRFGQRWNLPAGLLLRTLMDLVAIPSGVVAWDARDWLTTAAVVGVVGLLSAPLGPSPDVFVQRKLQAALGGEDHFRVWTKYGDLLIWFSIYGGLASMFLYGLVEDLPQYVEAPALAMEAFFVVQAYHWGLKFLTGRDGPDRNVVPGELTSDGTYHGPAGFVEPYGSGTPSGHAASMYAIFSVLMHYFDTPGLWIGLHLVAALFCVTVIADNYHFASEVILGAAMGYCVGRWVVEHRSSRYRNDDGGLPRRVWNAVKQHTSLAPAVFPGGGVGASVLVRWD
ncbi:MAG: phosphatase PAP2 family protein [Myxococcota bacterium]